MNTSLFPPPKTPRIMGNNRLLGDRPLSSVFQRGVFLLPCLSLLLFGGEASLLYIRGCFSHTARTEMVSLTHPDSCNVFTRREGRIWGEKFESAAVKKGLSLSLPGHALVCLQV